MKIENFTKYSLRFVQTEEMNKIKKENRSRKRDKTNRRKMKHKGSGEGAEKKDKKEGKHEIR
jgi:hypothetical protein